MRAVLDTNVVVSALVSPGGACSHLFRAVVNKHLRIIVAKEIVDEYKTVLARPRVAKRHRLAESEIDRVIELLCSHADTVVLPEPVPQIARDPDDDIFVAAAIAGDANVIVSGDIHLLEHGSFGDIPVLRPHEALALLVD